MGLSIAYQLSLPAETPRTAVVQRVQQLRARAVQMGFPLVTHLFEATPNSALGRAPRPLEVEWVFQSWAALTLCCDPEEDSFNTVPDAVGFAIAIGDECEPAVFGMAWAPARGADGNQLDDQPFCWSWSSVCKTQYASLVSTEHFVHCHTSLIALLDAAAELGFSVHVFDEGGYWESRDADRLLAVLENMNRLIATFAGALHDAIGDEHPIQAPIFSHPDFERLETKGMPPLG